MLIIGVISSAIQKAYATIIESFTRADSSTLGNSTGGQEWSLVRGSWGIVGNKARGVAADKSIATLDFTSTDVTIGIDGITPGCGTAFWVTDSGNWWGSYLEQTRTCSSCQAGGNCASWTSCCSSWTYTAGYTYLYANYAINGPGNTAPCSSCGVYTYCGTTCKKQNASTYTPSSYTCTGGYNSSCCSSSNAVYFVECNCVTNNSIGIIKSAAGSVTTLATKALAGTIVGIKTILSGSTITVRGFTGAGYTSASTSGDGTYTATSPVKTKEHGILLMPATYGQGTDIDEFRVE